MRSTTKRNVQTFTRTRLSTALNAALAAGLLAATVATAHAAPDKPWKEGHILVKPKAGLSDTEFDSILQRGNARSQGRIDDLPVHIVSVPPQAEEAVARALAKNPHVEFAELDMAVEASESIPNDPNFGNQWHLRKIQAPASWDYSKADNIVVAVLDTGVDGTHPDLAGKLLPGWNAVDSSNNTADINGHGTAVAGTAAAATNNASGVAGVAWNAAILPVRITNSSDGYAYWSDIARGLSWAANQGADVANISYGVSNSSTIASAAQSMRNKGGLVVVAAGNDGVDPGYANNAAMISVSATGSDDAKASWSNYGAFIDVAAPGVSIQTTSRGGGYGNWSGTSFASPVTAGAVAVIMGANPSLSADQVEKILKDSADNIAGDTHPYYGHGRINVAAAAALAASNNTRIAVDSEAPAVNIFSPGSGTTVSGLVQVAVNATDNAGVGEVSLYANGALVGTDDTSPYQFSWDSSQVADGAVVLSSTATDAAGNQGVSAGVNVSVRNQTQADLQAPAVRISQPANGSKVSGTITIAVSATDDVAVASLQLYIDGRLVSTASSGDMNYRWNTRKVKASQHSIAAVAADSTGKTSRTTITVYR